MAKKIGELLIEAHVITPEQLEHALAIQRGGDGRKLGQLLVELKIVTETQLTQGLGRQLAVPWVSLYHIEFSRSLLSFVPQDVAEKYCLVPIFVRKTRKGGETLYVAMDDPTNEQALRDVERNAGVPVRPMIACPSDIRSAIRVYYAGEAAPTASSSKPSGAPPAGSPPASTPKVVAAAPKPPAAVPVAVAAAVPRAAAPAPAGGAPSSAAAAAAAAVVEDLTDSAPEIEPMPDSAEEIETEDAPDSSPEIEATELTLKPRSKNRTLALTLLDGTTIQLPTPRHGSAARDATSERDPVSELTARDLVSALRAVAHGVDASEILGETPRWEAMFSALLSLLLKKGLVADWEFVEEYRKV